MLKNIWNPFVGERVCFYRKVFKRKLIAIRIAAPEEIKSEIRPIISRIKNAYEVSLFSFDVIQIPVYSFLI